jgi:hypothetical protein
MSSTFIEAWLQDIAKHISQDIEIQRPSKRQRRQHPVTPDPSEDCPFAKMPPLSPTKRRARKEYIRLCMYYIFYGNGLSQSTGRL